MMIKAGNDSKRADSYEPGQYGAEKMASLYEMALALSSAIDLDEMLTRVLERLHLVLGSDLCLVTLATADGQSLRIEAVQGVEAERLLGVEVPLDRGINAWIFSQGAPALLEDAHLDPRRLHIEGRTEAIRASIGAPLVADSQPIGTIYVACYQPHVFDEEDLNFLSIVATQIAAAVQRARLLEQARRRAEEMETLYDIGVVMASSLDVNRILQTIYEQAGRIMDTSAFFVALYEVERDNLYFGLIYDRGERVAPFSARLAGNQGLTAHVVRTARPLLIRNWELEKKDLPLEPLFLGEPAVSWLGVPVIVQDRVFGVIGSQSYEPYAFTNRQQRLLSAIANQAGISLQNARLLADLRLVNTDLQEMVSAQAHLLNTIEEMGAAPQLADSMGALGKPAPEE